MHKHFLHVGCGQKSQKSTTRGLAQADWTETRLDIDPSVMPDVVGTMTDMRALSAEQFEAIFSSHNIEHLEAHEVPDAMSEFMRVLKSDGIAIITCPDLQAIAELIAKGTLTEPVYQSPAGPISPIDMVFGHRPAIASGQHYMAHRTGFTGKTLTECLLAAGFKTVATIRRPHPHYDLWAIASKVVQDQASMTALARQHFPH